MTTQKRPPAGPSEVPLQDPKEVLRPPSAGSPWPIWSFEHDAWWAPDEHGYTRDRNLAGRYSQARATAIVRNANRGCTARNEAMVPADPAPLAAPSASLSEALTGKEGLEAAAQAERLRDELRREQDRSRGYKNSRDHLSVRHGEVCRLLERVRLVLSDCGALFGKGGLTILQGLPSIVATGERAKALEQEVAAALASEQPRAAPVTPFPTVPEAPMQWADGPFEEAAPLVTFNKLAADRLADEVAVLVRRHIIDSRSPVADALLDYRDPPYTPRSDRLSELEGRADSAPLEGLKDLERAAAPRVRYCIWRRPENQVGPPAMLMRACLDEKGRYCITTLAEFKTEIDGGAARAVADLEALLGTHHEAREALTSDKPAAPQAPSASAVPATQMGAAEHPGLTDASIDKMIARCATRDLSSNEPTGIIPVRALHSLLVEVKAARRNASDQPTAGPPAVPALPSCTPMRCRIGLDFNHCEAAGHLVPALPSGAKQPTDKESPHDGSEHEGVRGDREAGGRQAGMARVHGGPGLRGERREDGRPEDHPQGCDPAPGEVRAATAASPSVSAEERANEVMGLPRGPEYPNREIHARIAAAIRAAESAAYARGRKERDAEWREALLRMPCGHCHWPLIRGGPLDKGDSVTKPLTDADWRVRASCMWCESVRALLGSVATAPKAPPSPSGALAGAEELTTQETNQQRVGTPRAPDRGET